MKIKDMEKYRIKVSSLRYADWLIATCAAPTLQDAIINAAQRYTPPFLRDDLEKLRGCDSVTMTAAILKEEYGLIFYNAQTEEEIK